MVVATKAERIVGPRAVVGVRRRAVEVSIRAATPDLQRYFRHLETAILGGRKAASPSDTETMVRSLYRSTIAATGGSSVLTRELKGILDKQYLSMTQTVWEDVVGAQIGRRLDFDLNARGVERILEKVGTRITQINEASQRMIATRVEAEIRAGSNADRLEERLGDLLRSWGEDGGRAHIIALTESGFAYNYAATEGYRESGIVEMVQVYDGPECGWTEHDDPDLADGSTRTLDEADEYPLAHPHCQRAFGPVVLREEEAPAPAETAPAEPPAPVEEEVPPAPVEAEPVVPEDAAPPPVDDTPIVQAEPEPRGLPDEISLHLEEMHDKMETGAYLQPVDSVGGWGRYGEGVSMMVRMGWEDAARAAGMSVDDAMREGARVMQQTLDDATLSTRRSMNSLGRILDDGRFKSQFETGTSGGALNQEYRAAAETFMFGVPKAQEVTQRAIYGYMRMEGARDSASWYGDVLMDLKPAVRSRTTVTWGDSLGLEAQPSPLTAVRATSYNPNAMGGRGALPRPGRFGSPYTEAQIHGGLSADDILRITFERDPTPEIIRKVEAAGFVQDKAAAQRWVWVRKP